MTVQDQLRAATRQISSYGAVAVLGAGLSAPRYPMTGELRSLLWHAIDSNPAAKANLATALRKEDDTAKALIGEDQAAIEAAWRVVEENEQVRAAFQHAFARLDGDREPTPAHYALARLVHAGLIEYVVSFNWDTALERAHEQLFGTSLIGRADLLTKPHGDASAPQDRWILPHQAGVVPHGVLERIAELSGQRPRVLLVVGYSGSDAAVVEQLLEPAEGRWPVVRVGPSVEGPETVTGFADDAIPLLADLLNAPVDMEGWRWVGFSRSRDLRAALMGYRLGPNDVHACPELPTTRTVAERLRQAGFAVIVGDSGAGKSITAFQAAYRLQQEGWAVVELSQPGVASAEDVRTFESLRGRVLAVVDDAQALEPEVVRALERAVSKDHAVLLVATERPLGQELVRVSAAEAVATLVEYCEAHADVVEPLVREIDDRVGYGIMDEPFPHRLDAAKSSDYPWQFMHVLSGGERRVSGALANLRDDGNADLIFGMLAASQLLSLDAGTTSDALARYAVAVERDAEWLANGLGALAEQRLVVSRAGRLRTPHMRIADHGLLVLCRDQANPQWRTLVAFLRSRLLDPAEPLRGKLWMLRAIDQADPLRYGNRDLLLDGETVSFLVDTCLAAPAGRERSIAAYLLWELGWWRALSRQTAEVIATAMPAWISEMTSGDVYGIRWLLGGLRANFPDLHGAVSAQVQPEEVAQLIAEHGSPGSADSWGHLLSELAHAEGVNTKAWASRFQDSLVTVRLVEWVQSVDGSASLRGNIEFAKDLAGLAPRAAATVISAMGPSLASRLERDPAGAARDLVPWAFSLFPLISSQDESFWDAEDDYRALRDAVLEWIARTNWNLVGQRLTQAALHDVDQLDLLTFSINSVAPEALATMVASVSFDDLDRITTGCWRDLARIEDLIHSLGHGPNREPARSWVHRHSDEIRRVPTTIVPIAPWDTVKVLAEGGAVELEVHAGLRWGDCTEALNALLEVDKGAARAVVESSRAAIVEGLVLRQANMVEYLVDFVRTLDAIDPHLIVELLDEVELDQARRHWTERLAGTDKEAAAADLLVDRALQAAGEIRGVALALREPT